MRGGSERGDSEGHRLDIGGSERGSLQLGLALLVFCAAGATWFACWRTWQVARLAARQLALDRCVAESALGIVDLARARREGEVTAWCPEKARLRVTRERKTTHDSGVSTIRILARGGLLSSAATVRIPGGEGVPAAEWAPADAGGGDGFH
jgi:hypothetical protein